MTRNFLVAIALVLTFATSALGESITVVSYNVQLFSQHFLHHRLTGRGLRTALPDELRQHPQIKELLEDELVNNDRLNWLVSMVILDPKLSPDVIAFEECCSQSDLEYFNKRWLNDAYETVMVFPTNTTRQQNLGMMLKKGFTAVEKRDQYFQEKDPVPNARGDKLFARGPSFVKVKSPGGYTFWVGVTHQKSKRVDPPMNPDGTYQRMNAAERDKLEIDGAQWRLREGQRTHQIMKELEAAGPSDVMIVGDMNDELGEDEIEQKAGGDAIASLLGPPADGFVLATKSLADTKQFSYGGYWKTRYRTLIDHVIVSKSMAAEVQTVGIFKEGLAAAASDHYPVFVKLNTEGAKK